jgi:YD repeat-containing protein
LLTDGAAFKFKIATNNPKCVEVKDSNGNYISITYTPFEQISAITDTMGRVVNYKYDGSNRLVAIAQDWSGGTHNYATFAYDILTIQTNFLGLDLVGAANGATISVLSRVDMADGKVYAFEYNTYAQVKTIRCYAPNSANPGNFPDDYTLLSSISYDLTPDEQAGQTDCPRFSSRKDWAKDWNAVTENGAISIYDGDGATWGSATAPDGTEYKEFFGASGWQRGLTLQTEIWSNGSKKKWTDSTWANDNPNVSYWLNPRVVETNVYDEHGGRRRTKIDYADFGAVSDISEYDTPHNPSTVLRRTHFDYLRGTAYTGNLKRRLTQLVTSQKVFDGGGALQSKVTNEYDLGGQYLVDQGQTIRHDTTNFGLNFIQGRGNLNRVRRWDVTAQDDVNKSVASTVGYNTSGSVIFSRDPLNHQKSISYTDSFSDSVNRNTLAYPTRVTDADNYSSTVQYIYDFGAVKRSQDPKGAAEVNTYDSIGRLAQSTNEANSAYTRYVYSPNHLSVQSYTTVNDLSSEFYQIAVVDGHGRMRGAASELPGSVGGYKAQNYEYNIMGRLVRQTNPTEIDVNWSPKGDDTGWVWSSQSYDWLGRTTDSTNQDGTTTSISYEGCGCAGGQSVSTFDEMGRKQMAFYDVLGRLSKTQAFNWDGTTVYSTAINTYNARDQVIRVRAFKGAGPAPGDESCPTGLCQETVMGYDGYGRLISRKRPEEGGSGTVYTYYNDDLMRTATDARGASSTFSYNARHLTTNIAYSSPNESAVPNTPSVSFQYDQNGNRTVMNDGAGTVTYGYNTLGLLTSETRQFSELVSYHFVHKGTGQPIQTSYQIGYSYNIGRQLQSITTPTGDTIDYARDKAGRITRVSGTPRDGVADYVSDIDYRAWGRRSDTPSATRTTRSR